MQALNLFTLAATPAHRPYADHVPTDFPVGTTLEDRYGCRTVIIATKAGPRFLKDPSDGETPQTWHSSRPVNLDGSPWVECQYIDYEDRDGRVFVTADGDKWLSVYGLGLYNDEGQRVYAVGLDDKSAKLLTAKAVGYWLDPV